MLRSYKYLQAEDKGVAFTVSAYLDDEIHLPPPRYGIIYISNWRAFLPSIQ